jgi:hypothetical protein
MPSSKKKNKKKKGKNNKPNVKPKAASGPPLQPLPQTVVHTAEIASAAQQRHDLPLATAAAKDDDKWVCIRSPYSDLAASELMQALLDQAADVADQEKRAAASGKIAARSPGSGDVCWVCMHDESEDGDSLISMGCGCRGSAGLVHLSCLVAAAKHNAATWNSCPTCKQHLSGHCAVEMSRTRWELARHKPSDDAERLLAANSLAARLTNDMGDHPGAAVLLKEVVSTRRRTLGSSHPDTLTAISNLGKNYTASDNVQAGMRLSEEALAGWLKICGPDDPETISAMRTVANVRQVAGDMAGARVLHTEALEKWRRTVGHKHSETLYSMEKLGICLVNIGAHKEGLKMLDDTLAGYRETLGPSHPQVQHFVKGKMQQVEHMTRGCQSHDALALGVLTGLVSKPELNGGIVFTAIYSFDAAASRYTCRRTNLPAKGTRSMAIKPANFLLKDGTAVLIQGLQAAPEWNGCSAVIKSGGAETTDVNLPAAQKRYVVLVEGRNRALRIPIACCRIEVAS